MENRKHLRHKLQLSCCIRSEKDIAHEAIQAEFTSPKQTVKIANVYSILQSADSKCS